MGNVTIIEGRFPPDSKVVEIMHNYMRAMLYVVIESASYPDVRAPTEVKIVCHSDKTWDVPEKVTFT